MKDSEARWHSISVEVKSDGADAVEHAFNVIDSLGTEISDMPIASSESVTVVGYFDRPVNIAAVEAEISAALDLFGVPSDAVLSMRQAEIENQDWLAEWKKYWKPTRVGRFVIAAPWHEIDDESCVVIRVEPGMAFGTGTHETTKLCLAAIDALHQSSDSFLDVGTGTGILAIAAARISDPRARILGFDVDPDAVQIARENAALNSVENRIGFNTVSLDEQPDDYDFVCANLTADVTSNMLPALLTKAKRVLVLSGILAEQETVIVSELIGKKFEVSRDGEWISIVVDNQGLSLS